MWIKTQNNYTRIRDPRNLDKVSANSLLFYYGNFHSQRGQDGILTEIFRRLGIWTGYFVEFGAWDGCYLSNSRSLYERGWGGVFIEGNERRYQKLLNTYKGARDVKTICAFVGAPSFGIGTVTLAELLREHCVDPGSVSFLSIDVDGVDLEIFEDMGMTPSVVLIEGGFNFSPRVKTRVPLEIARNNMQQPLSVIVDVAKKSGYSPVCFLQDTYLVRTDLLGEALAELPVDKLYSDAWFFMDDEFRHQLISLRSGSPIIKRIEQEVLGRFVPDPCA